MAVELTNSKNSHLVELNPRVSVCLNEDVSGVCLAIESKRLASSYAMAIIHTHRICKEFFHSIVCLRLLYVSIEVLKRLHFKITRIFS